MLFRTFPKLPEVELSVFGMGLMRLPRSEQGDIDYNTAGDMVEAALAGGVNYFDTAWPYHGGQSQEFARDALKAHYGRIHLATKLPTWFVNKADDLDYYLDEQLKILDTDCIEFYLMHGLGDDRWENLQRAGMLEFLDRAVSDGRIKYPCFSYHGSVGVFEQIIDAYDNWMMAQIMLNYVDQNFQAGVEGMRYADSRNVGIVVMEPLKGGMLANKLSADVRGLFDAAGVDPVAAAMRWVYDFKEPTVVLSGVSAPEQLKGQLEIARGALPGCLSGRERELVEQARGAFELVPCSACRYCQPCPQDVHIPDIMSWYNDEKVFGNNRHALYMDLAEKGHGADRCIECGACETLCPQQIGIIQVLKDAHALLTK